MGNIRIDKFLADSGVGSRADVKNIIKKGRVLVDGTVVKDPGLKVSKEQEIVFDGKRLSYEKYHYYMLNKPQGVVSATDDNTARTVIDILSDENVKSLFPVGRLDKDTEGLLLITDDGELSHNLLSPRKHVEKTYFVVSDAELSKDHIALIEEGIDIGDDKLCKPAKIELADENEGQVKGILNRISSNDLMTDIKGEMFFYYLRITEGRFHQVKRMFKACDANVIFLKRLSMGPLALDETLMPGEYRKLTQSEIDLLK